MSRRVVAVMMCVYLVGAAVVAGQAPRVSEAEVAREAAAIVRAWSDPGWLHGAVLVGRGETVVYRGASGWAHPAYRVANTVDTTFNIGSLTQLFTAATVLRLQDKGRLSVDDPVGRFMPDWPEPVRNIRISQLLTGWSGLKEVTQIPAFTSGTASPRTFADLVDLIIREPVSVPPAGPSPRASAHVLVAIIEKVTAQAYMDVLRTEILAPLQLHDTRHDALTEVAARRSVSFGRRGSELLLSPPFDMTNAWGAGNLKSTVADVFVFTRALATGKLVSSRSLAAMTTNHAPLPKNTPPNAVIPGTGFGWSLRAGPTPVWQAGGLLAGYASSLTYLPATDETIVVLTNGSSGELTAVAGGLRNLLSGEPAYRPEPRRPVSPSARDLTALAGTWEVTGVVVLGPDGKRAPQQLTVRVEFDRLMVSVAQGAPEFEWFAAGPRRFFNPSIDQVLELPEDPEKPVQYRFFGTARPLKRAGS